MSTLFDDTDLFTSGRYAQTDFDLPDASLVLIEHFFTKEESDRLYHALLKDTKWKQEDITVYGKTHLTPRLTAWYGDTGRSYTFSGKKWDPYPWTPDLLFIKDRIEGRIGEWPGSHGMPAGSKPTFNSVLLNLYRDGKDSVGWHRDDEPEFGPDPVIASVSFGETRPFHLRHKFRKDLQKLEIPLTHGSFLLMAGKTQHYWEHQIPKTARPISPRINLTFRLIK